MKTLIWVALTLVCAIACTQKSSADPEGDDVKASFLEKYSGKFSEPDFKENVVIYSNGMMDRTEERQVGGGQDSKVPYPTVCSYTQHATIDSVIKRNDESRGRYMDYATHVIKYHVNSISLTDELEHTTSTNPDCLTFLKEQQAQIRRGLNYSLYTELLDDNTMRFQTAGGGDYHQGGQRTPSTLDEVYSRQ